MKNTSIQKLILKLQEIARLGSILALLDWDQNVGMPRKGVDLRSASIADLSSLIHSKFINIDSGGLLTKLKKQLDKKELKGKDAVIVHETWRSFDRARKLPDSFVREMAETTSKAQGIWAKAREQNNFNSFLPTLEKVVELKRKEAEYVGYTDTPYNALLDSYEPGMTSDEAYRILNDLKDFLIPFIKKIKQSKIKVDSRKLRGKFPIDQQIVFNEFVVKKIGFDLEAGRIDKTVHPFAITLHPHDVRITTRYSEDDALYSFGSVIHEAGHGLYEQGLVPEYYGTPLGESVSLGIHESQSRMWENLIGRSEEFWKYFYPHLQKIFPNPYKKIPVSELYQIINEVKPSLIRTESDEVTYNLHVILRFEIEKEMIEGSIDLKDLPEIWNDRMNEYLGVKVSSDSLGVLQDVHWSCGLIGYFPTYTFGNLYSAQFYSAMKRDIPNMPKKIEKGQFQEMREWLRNQIHAKGKTYTASKLVRKVTGENLNSQHFIDYITEKYSKLYNLK